MNILVVGGGGREHAIIKKLKEDPRAEKIYALPGNGGIAADAVCLEGSATDIPAVIAAARENGIDFVVVAPDDPLVMGMVDALEAEGFPCFGPRKNAAVIEGSKAFSKDLMKKYGIPTAAYETFTDMDKALACVDACPLPAVVKADGLALGKGVLICETREAAREAVRSMMEDRLFGDSGATVVIEEFLTGPEVSVLAFTDGETVVPMASSMDHKRALDGDQGLNTGGMGTIAPNPCYTPEIAAKCMETIFLPTIRAMKAEGRPFRGCLYFGLMLTPDGPRVIEYNCRFGDPETQVVLPLLESSLLEIMLAVSRGKLSETEVKFSDKSACCVILASEGYPQKYEKGFPITLPETAADEQICIAGAARKDGKLLTSGGRVLGAVAVAEDLPAAVSKAYTLAGKIHFGNAFCRRDIGRRALRALEEKRDRHSSAARLNDRSGSLPAAQMVYRIFVEKREGLSPEAGNLLGDLRGFLGVESLEGVRILNRYDVEGIDPAVYEKAKHIVFSEPQADVVWDETFPEPRTYHSLLAVEALPGQFDQRSDSCAQCVQLMAGVERPLVRHAKVYMLQGRLSREDLDKIRGYLINPVESREASMDKPETLVRSHDMPPMVETLTGFTGLDGAGLSAMLEKLGLAMDLDDLKFLQAYFRDTERRDPTITEVRVVDTYWSDHCRHTTFSTHLDDIRIEAPDGKYDTSVEAAYKRYLAARAEVYGEEKAAARPQTLMDIATIGTKVLKKRGLLPELDESEEINACSIHVPAVVDGQEQDWLLMFKNETHNHPTEIEPFGGAATCIGGCIRDPLSGRAYVHQAMRVTGCGDPRASFEDTLPGKLPQRKLATTAAAGYSSYGNQIGLATGHVAELYHPGYIAKHLECGAVVAAAPASSVRRERPEAGDVVILLGGRTGRDGIGGATGSSKSHNLKSLTAMASEVQKGNAPEERKLQRLFRNPHVTRMIKRCNDFGAGGVSVAIGELADGLEIDLDAVRKKYDGLDGTELAISESQERMAVVVAPEDEEQFIFLAEAENLEAYRAAVVTESPRMVMKWRGETIADLSRAFLDTNGAVKHAAVSVKEKDRDAMGKPKFSSLRELASSLACASRRGLVERFDGSIGAGSVTMPFGGKTQRTPAQSMTALLPVLPGQETEQASVMACGCDPERLSIDPFSGAMDAVVTSLTKLVAAGADYKKAYLTLQEFFEKLRNDPERWGKPFAALLGALEAQLDYGCAAIGGKDSMSGSFMDLDVPPTVISFAIAPIRAGEVITPEFKEAGHPVYLFSGADPEQTKAEWDAFHALAQAGKVKAAWAIEDSIAEAVMKMSFGNRVGFRPEAGLEDGLWYTPLYGAIVAELAEDTGCPYARRVGETTAEPVVAIPGDSASIDELLKRNESVLEDVYPTRVETDGELPLAIISEKGVMAAPVLARHKCAKPRVVIPVFPGTNCEYDSVRACLRAGMEAETVVVRNLTHDALAQSAVELERAIRQAQIVFLPGGFSGGDEPDGSAKFIVSFLRNPRLTDAIHDLLKNRDGLMLGICNGFQALVKLGLVPFGEIRDTDEECPTLTYNAIGRHQSSIVRTRVCSRLSPWLMEAEMGGIYSVPISHGEGRFIAPAELLRRMDANGQIATRYVDLNGLPSMDTAFNPNGSMEAVEGITSPDGRVLGKMGHSERIGPGLYRNVPGEYDMGLFRSAVKYFQ